MSQLINRGKELIRINPTNKQRIEFSTNNGVSWRHRFFGCTCGDFIELTANGNEIIATTSKGLYYTKNEGTSWAKRS